MFCKRFCCPSWSRQTTKEKKLCPARRETGSRKTREVEMAGFATPEIDNQLEPAPEGGGQFGIALEPQAVKICGYALIVGMIGGLVAQGLLELIYLFTNIFFYERVSFAISY